MTRIITATEAKNRLGEWLKHVYRNNEAVVVEKSGFPVAAIISMAEYSKCYPTNKDSRQLSETRNVIKIARDSLRHAVSKTNAKSRAK